MTTVSTVTDDELALESSGGNQEAFEALYRRHHRGIYDLACRMMRDPDAAADVTQTTFINAWVNLQKRHVSGNVRGWLYTIARNTAINELNRGRRSVPLDDNLEARGLPYADVDRDRLPNPERVARDKEVAQLVWDSAAALNPKEYSLLDLHLRKGLTPAEIAQSMGLSKGNVHIMLYRLRRSLEESVTSMLLARRGRQDCPQLDALLTGKDVSTLSKEVRTQVMKHLEVCTRCQQSRRRFVSPAEIFAGLVLIPMPEDSPAAVWTAIAAAAAAGGAAVGLAAHGAQAGARGLLQGARSLYAIAAAGVAATAAAVAGAVILLSGGGGGSVEDPSDVHSSSHQIGEPSTERVVVITWTPQTDVDGYSVSWSRAERDLPDRLRDLPGDASRAESPPLPDGSWYFHMRTEDGGEWTSTVHVGPFVIRGTPPATPTPTPAPQAQSPTPTPAVAAASQAPTGSTGTPAPPQSAETPAAASPTAPPPGVPSATPSPPPALPPTPSPPPPPGLLSARIDIKPGDSTNNVNSNARQLVAVALLSTELLPASNVDVATARFAGAQPVRWTMRDVDGDGTLDLVAHFEREEMSLAPQDREACLEGKTLQGAPFVGCDAVRPLGPGVARAGAGGELTPGILLAAAAIATPFAALRRRSRSG